MILTVLMWVGFAVLGACVFCAGAFGLMFLISKTAVDITKHKWDCQCGRCQEERLRTYRQRNRRPYPADKGRDIKPRGNERWISTIELHPGMYIVGGKDRGKTFRVASKSATGSGYLIRLVTTGSHTESIIFIEYDKALRPRWLLVATEESGE